MLERLLKLERKVLDESQIDTSRVTVLSKVTIKNTNNGAQLTYKLVSESEADLKSKKISVSSPIGQGLLGKEIGDIATISTPRGELKFEIVEITV